MKPRILAFLGALFLVAWAALPVLAAAPPGKVSVESDGCTFTVHINLDHAYDLVGWKVKEYNAANWNDGLTLFKGSGPTDGNGDLTVGPFTAAEGRYTVAVDDEYPPDGSSIVIDFWLSCQAASEAPSTEPSTAPSTAPSTEPSTQPSGSELPIEGSAPPSGEVGGIVGTPPALTPPPTDTAAVAADSTGSGWLAIVAVIVAASAAMMLLVPTPLDRARAITRRRR